MKLRGELAQLLDPSGDKVTTRVEEAVVLELFQQGEISSRKAAQFLGITWDDFLQMLTERQIPYFRQTIEEILHDRDVAARIRPDQRQVIVAESSPIISLGRINQLHLSHSLFGTVVIPEAVRSEIGTQRRGLPERLPEWIVSRAVEESVLVAGLRLAVDPGEAEAIALAVDLQSELLIDEQDGRRVAASLGLDFTGTLGALLVAKQRGLISRVDTMVDALLDQRFHVSGQVVAEVLRAAGEA